MVQRVTKNEKNHQNDTQESASFQASSSWPEWINSKNVSNRNVNTILIY